MKKQLILLFALLISTASFAHDMYAISGPASALNRQVYGSTAFNSVYELVRANDLDSLQTYVGSFCPRQGWCKVLNSYRSSSGFTPLHRALTKAQGIDADIVAFLLKSGANPNEPLLHGVDQTPYGGGFFLEGFTAGHIAVRMKAGYAILKILQGSGCDFTQKDDNGISPLELAFVENNFEALKTLSRIMSLKNMTCGVNANGWVSFSPEEPKLSPEHMKSVFSFIRDQWGLHHQDTVVMQNCIMFQTTNSYNAPVITVGIFKDGRVEYFSNEIAVWHPFDLWFLP